jgi:hypothetical protein
MVVRARITYLVSLLALLAPLGTAAGETDWDWTVSAEGDAVTRCVATDAAGNICVAGSYLAELSLDTLTLTSVDATSDVFLIKLAPNGHVIWGRSAGGGRLDRCWSVTCDPSGRVYITGEFCSNSITFDTITLENNYQTPYHDDSSFDVFTACYSAQGEILWARKAGGVWHDKACQIALDSEENVYILGTFYSSEMVLDTLSLTNTGNIDLFLARYDRDGHIQWARNAAGTGQENAWSLAVDSQDMIYIAGSYRGPTLTIDGRVLTNTSDDFDLYLMKFDSRGSTRWVRSASGQEWDDAEALAVDPWDNVYLAGHFRSDTLSFDTIQLFLSDNENLNVDMYLAKFDGDGQAAWAVSSAGPAWPYPDAACLWSTDRIAVVGSFTGCAFGDSERFDTCTITTHGSYDIFLVDYDNDGYALSAENLGGPGMDFGQDVCRDGQGNLYLGAYFSSDSQSIGPVTLFNDHTNKMFVAKRLNPDLASVPGGEQRGSPISQSIVSFSAPNPFNARAAISYELGHGGHVRLTICDLGGRVIRTLVDRFQPRGSHTVIWDGRDSRQNDVASGVYLYELTTDMHQGVGRMTLIK